jgi:hypothetical protein
MQHPGMEHPFPYVGSGIAAARKTMECFVCFRAPVPKAERAALETGVPGPLAGFFHWSERALAFGHADDSLQWVVRAHYDHVADEDDEHEPDPELPSDAQWRALSSELDAWLLGVHARHPIAVVVKPIDEEYSTATDAWHEWSCERIPTEALPALEALGKRHAAVATYVADTWRAWAAEQSVIQQRELLAALPEAARAALARHDALFEPAPPPPPVAPRPTLEESEQIWRAHAAGGPLRLEDAYTAALLERGLDDEYTLTDHLHVLEEAERHGDIVELARAVLASRAEFPVHWLRPAIDSLIALDRVPEATALMPALVGHLESYSPDMLVTAMRYHRAVGEPAVEAMLYHAGMRWFTTFSYLVTKAEAEAYGPPPEDLPAQLAAWLARWIAATEWDAATQPRLAHWLAWFDAIGKQHFAAQVAAFEAERDRRVALRERLRQVTGEAAASEIVAQLLPTADTEDAASAFHALRAHAPVAAYELLLGALRHERREGYRFPRGYRVDAVTSLLWLPLNVPALHERRAEAYEIGAGYELVRNAALHYNLGCIAARLGDRAAALRHVARSLALGFEPPRQLHDDESFASLRGDPEFEALFPAAAEREPRAKAKPARKPKQAKTAKPAKPKAAKAKASKPKAMKAKPRAKPKASKAKPRAKPKASKAKPRAKPKASKAKPRAKPKRR